MPFNKYHQIVDDAFSYPYMNDAHVTRAGLLLGTIDKSKPVPLSKAFVDRLLRVEPKSEGVDMVKLRELGPVVLQLDGVSDEGPRFIISILVVPMDEKEQIHCYPYSNNNPEEKMWPYDKHFVISNLTPLADIQVSARETHPLAGAEGLDPIGVDHMTAMTTIVLKFVIGLQQGDIELVPDTTDYSKLNAKRAKSKKAPIKGDYLPVFVG
jgi:hypothetical protein